MLEPGASSSSSTTHHHNTRERSRSRSHSPENSPDADETESRMADSLYRANATIDEYTTTLAKISRAPTPDDPELLRCCCGRADCENTAAWFAFKNKLEGRLILCAEVGQALLEKHEAYVRRHDTNYMSDSDSNDSRPATPTIRYPLQDSQTDGKVFQLTKENSILEKRLNAALLNADIAEASNKALLKELSETKEMLSRLTVTQVKSTGLETRLNTTAQEKDDLQQELDSERSRAKISEGQITALRERCAKQQGEINRLYDEMVHHRQSRKELSEEILRDARARLQMVQQQQLGHIVSTINPEVSQVMESLVADNEALKRDIAELQNLLVESREDVRTLREEVEESRASALTAGRPEHFRPEHMHTSSWASSFGQRPISPAMRSVGLPIQPYEPLTPSTENRPLSRSSRSTSRSRLSAPNSRPAYTPSRASFDNEERNESVETRSYKRPLKLLSQTKGIQTDDINWSSLLTPFRVPTDDASSSNPRGEGHSETSSLVDAHSSTIAALISRANALFVRLAQADARTLTNRLKRQRLTGDVSHISHATVTSILNEVNGLRSHFRTALEDERSVSTCTRKDLRALLSLLREIFAELGQIRTTLNDIILDPSIAQRISEAAMDPSKSLEAMRGRGATRMGTLAGNWIAPLSKLFSGNGAHVSESKPSDAPQVSSRIVSNPIAPKARAPRLAPKSGPALAASTTTVNVEFSNSGVGRSVSSNMSATIAQAEGQAVRSSTPVPGVMPSRAVMGIFAGAPQSPGPDSWVMLPKPNRRLRPAPSAVDMRTATLTRSAGRWAGSKLSRNVDAIVDASSSSIHDDSDSDDEGDEAPETLLERTLRPRGLSDSSIRSTFLKDAAEAGVDPSDMRTPVVTSPGRQRASLRGGSSLRQSTLPGGVPTRPSVFQAFTKAFATIPALSSHPHTGPTTDTVHDQDSHQSSSPIAPSSEEGSHATSSTSGASRAPSPRRMPMLPSLTHWAATHAGLDAEATEHFVGSVREAEDPGARHWTWQRDLQDREF